MTETQEASSQPKEEKPAVDAKQHDDVYEAVFALVGGKQKTETYEDLAKVLPALKDSDPAELKELAARKALQEMLKPKVDPLRLEYEQAAAEEDVDDLSTEDGTEWLQSKGLAGGDDEELDENGIPVVKLTRASSSFILDGPGDVKVDNFTPEGEDAEGERAPAATAPAPAAAPSMPSTAAAASSGSSGAAAASYVPSIIARAAGVTTAPAGANNRSSNVAGAKPAAGAVAPGPVVTLEDELKALRAARSAASQQQPEAAVGGAGGSSSTGAAAPADWQVSDVAADDEDAPEIIMEPAGAPGGSRRSIQLYSPSTAAAGDAAATGPGTGGPPSGPAGGSGSGATAGAPGSTQAEEPSCLPGECQDTRREDAVWQAMHGGVDGRALLEHIGLGEGGAGRAGSGDESGGEEEVDAARKEPLANGHGGLANGHATTNSGAGVSASPGGNAQAPSSSGPAAGASPDAATAPTSGSGPAAIAGTAAPAGAAAAAAAAAPDEAGTASSAAAQPQDQQLALRASAPWVGASSSSDATDGGPVFQEVEKFSLDPDFDYDNVVLTRREFPYTMLGAFGRAGGRAK
ncbi:hypothetical protein HYH02_005684 [Chlamydomonas schloesseri]|uniref:Uncharacterized protein n=1 Tax=Chlamydomonas schloesseri TaxID=2026947 RepID=A0A836B724_9CHLO|nr:hypothetical protein HYH02_005684 [Chlamydomonas schloesseri]|eukprot:KAG2449542.1 hypothetical protein HYH02_005684 [Chlamydomonas schloesseri]